VKVDRAGFAPTLRAIWPRDEQGRAVSPGVEGNARLTALTGLVLLVLLFVEGITVFNVRGLLSLHVFVGLMLIPPLLLKTASTGYRFASYYLGSRQYRAAGPPQTLLRVLAPFLLASTVGLFGTGVVLLALGSQSRDTWRGVHQLFFFFWFGFMAIHVLTYTWRATRLGVSDVTSLRGDDGAIRPAVTRQSLVIGSVLLGLAIAIAFLPSDASWLQWASARGG
jgi:hypothetical protein